MRSTRSLLYLALTVSLVGCTAEYDQMNGPVKQTTNSDGSTTVEVGPGGSMTSTRIEPAIPGPKVQVKVQKGPDGVSGSLSAQK